MNTKSPELFAGIAVANYPAALQWYERLLGFPPTFFPTDVEAVWTLGEHRHLFIEHKPEHAGHTRHLIFVDDLEAVVTQIANRELGSVGEEAYPNGVRKVTYHDPDGNKIEFGGVVP